jgi:alpha-galactosidase
MHGRLWLNDPDCMLARDSETALTAEEVRTLATVIAMSGGMALDSDNLMRLSDERREIVSMLLPPYGKSAVPLDLFESEMPRLLELDCGAHKLLAVFNWADQPAEVKALLPDRETHVFEVWEREYLGIRQGSLLGELPAHGCRLLVLRPALGHPQLVGSSFHLLQGAVELTAEEWDGETLRLSLRPVAKREGELFVWAPDGWGRPAVSGPEGIEVTEKPGGLWSVRLDVERETEVRLAWSRTAA